MISLILRILGFSIWTVHFFTDLTGINRGHIPSSVTFLQNVGWDFDAARQFVLWVNIYTIVATICIIVGFAIQPNKSRK